MSEPVEVAATIRAALRERHDAIEKTPFARALIGGSLSADDYRRALNELHVLHSRLEGRLTAAVELAGIYRPEQMARTSALERDLAALGTAPGPATLPATTQLVDRIDDWAEKMPAALLGALYVVEGSRMGSRFLYKPLAAALGVPPEPGKGVDYHLQGMDEQPASWNRFRADLETFARATEAGPVVISAAAAAMDGLYAVYDSLPVSSVQAPVAASEGAQG
ncbi:MAG: biliverdin-producing heme oxygenase [Planctomycetia bacterium]